MYRTPVTSPSKTTRRFSQDSPPPSKKEEKKDVIKQFIDRPQTKRRSLDVKRKYDSKLKNEMQKDNTQDLLKKAMTFFEETAETVYGQMRRDVKTKLEEIADQGLGIMYEIGRRSMEGQDKTEKEESKEGIEEQLRELREEMKRNMEEWRNKKEKEEEKKQEVEEIIISMKEEIGGIIKKIETSEDNIIAEVIDLERKMKGTGRTHRNTDKEKGREEEKEGGGSGEQKIEEIKEAIEELKDITTKGIKEIGEKQGNSHEKIRQMEYWVMSA
ncbi:unnamed protein product [Diatraea saccharalis]|uniref:Uncharacterized protein n=1 Tax=Diatraea saccharalis TaxID=40085 RepID=A0A9N9R622_9NEOP|nr:unnamed protein product [Diatraea saccharalis]